MKTIPTLFSATYTSNNHLNVSIWTKEMFFFLDVNWTYVFFLHRILLKLHFIVQLKNYMNEIQENIVVKG
jgi:hypothetical protein